MSGNFSPIFAHLKARRLDLKLSQEEAAKRAGITQTYLSKIEQGKIEPRLHTLEDIARALNLDLRLVPVELLPAISSLLQASDNPEPLFAVRPE